MPSAIPFNFIPKTVESFINHVSQVVDCFDRLEIFQTERFHLYTDNILINFLHLPDILRNNLIRSDHIVYIPPDLLDLPTYPHLFLYHTLQSLQLLGHLLQVNFVERKVVIVEMLVDAIYTPAEEQVAEGVCAVI